MINENKFRKFEKSERSSFAYWFNHWRAFNAVARDLGAWKFKYLFHDFGKPWLKLLWGDYSRVQKWHREHNDHHIEYKGGKIDWEALVIDWECSRYTKKASPLTAREEAWMQYTHGELSATDYEMILATADKLGLDKSYRLLPLHKEFLHKHQNVE